MDPSNRLECILKGYQAKAEDLSKDEWRAIITEALGICKPLLKHAHGFKGLSVHLDNFFGEAAHILINTGLVTFSGDVNYRTRCLKILEFTSSPNEDKIIKETKLLLTQDGLWIAWEASYQESIKEDPNNIAGYAIKSGFMTTPDPIDLLDSSDQLIGVHILIALRESLNGAIFKRRQWLSNLERAAVIIDNIATRSGA